MSWAVKSFQEVSDMSKKFGGLAAVYLMIFLWGVPHGPGGRASAERTQSASVQAMPQFASRILVQFRPGTNADRAREITAGAGGREVGEIPQIGVQILELPVGANEEAMSRAFRERSEVAFAEPDRVVPPADLIPDDPYYGVEWHLPKISAPAGWSTS